jgi:hypothetical protein
MFLVTIEDEDGYWWDEAHPFDTARDAQNFAATCAPPEGYEPVIWVCRIADLPKVKE